MGPFGPQDKRFQLPGHVGFGRQLEDTAEQKPNPVPTVLPDILTSPSNAERHEFVLAQYINEFHVEKLSVFNSVAHPSSVRNVFGYIFVYLCSNQENTKVSAAHREDSAEQYFHHAQVECAIQSCPELLKKGETLWATRWQH